MSAKPIDAKVVTSEPEYEYTDAIGMSAAMAHLYCDRCGHSLRWGTRVYLTAQGKYCTKGCATADLAQGVLQ